MGPTHSSALTGDNTMGSTLNQGTVHAGGNLHLGNNNTYIGRDKDKDHYKGCLRELLSSLPGDPRDHKEDLITRNGRWLKGTCQWILRTKEFIKWHESKPPQLLWITGGPGKGKTMLAHFLVDYCETVGAREPDRELVIYFFCGTQDGLNSGPSLLRGLIYQILLRNKATFCHIKEAFSNHGKSLFNDAQFEALWRVFDSMIRDKTLKSVTCILDGLDECIEESLAPFLVKIRDVFTRTTRQRSKTPSSIFKAIAISRNFPESFEMFLDKFPRLRIDASHNVEIGKDVSKYIDDRMKLLACAEHKKPKLGQLRFNVRQKLVNSADGSYLWVRFAIKSLEGVTCPELEGAITEFPRGLDDVYARMLRTLPERQKDKVVEIIRWVATVYRPLTLLELGTALDLPRADDQDLGDATADFVQCARDLLVISRANYVTLVHASFRDFLIKSDNDAVPGNLRESSTSHWALASRTLDYFHALITSNPDMDCSLTNKHHFNGYFELHPLLKYFLEYCLQHFSEMTTADASSMHHPLLDENDSAHYPWICAQTVTNSQYSFRWNLSLLHLVSLLGHIGLVRYCVVHHRIDVNIRDERERTPIFYAVLSGSTMVFECLLSHGANPSSVDVAGEQPIHIACGTGALAIADALLNANVTPNTPTTALAKTPDDLVVSGLLEDCTDESIHLEWNEPGATPLHFAVYYGCVNLVELLLERGAELNLKDEMGRTALHYARVWEYRHNDAAAILIKAGIDIYASDLEGNTAFHRLVTSGISEDVDDLKTVTVLLDCGFPIDTPTQPSTAERLGGATALQLASHSGTIFTVAFLLEHGADINHRDNLGRTALHHVSTRDMAAFRQVDEVCSISRLLLNKMSGAAIMARDSDGRSAHEMASETDERTQKQLQDVYAKTNQPGCEGLRSLFSFKAYEARRSEGTRAIDLLESRFTVIPADWTPDLESKFFGFVRSLGGESGEDLASMILRQRREYREAAEV